MHGSLQHNGVEAHLLLEHQSAGYFNNEMLVSQVEKVIGIFDRKYPGAQGLFIFDHAPSHMKCPEDALYPDQMKRQRWGYAAIFERHQVG